MRSVSGGGGDKDRDKIIDPSQHRGRGGREFMTALISGLQMCRGWLGTRFGGNHEFGFGCIEFTAKWQKNAINSGLNK